MLLDHGQNENYVDYLVSMVYFYLDMRKYQLCNNCYNLFSEDRIKYTITNDEFMLKKTIVNHIMEKLLNSDKDNCSFYFN